MPSSRAGWSQAPERVNRDRGPRCDLRFPGRSCEPQSNREHRTLHREGHPLRRRADDGGPEDRPYPGVDPALAGAVAVSRRRHRKHSVPGVRGGPVHRAAPRRLPSHAKSEGRERGPLSPRPRRERKAEARAGDAFVLDRLGAVRDRRGQLPRVLRGARARSRRHPRPLHRLTLPRDGRSDERAPRLRRAHRRRLHPEEARQGIRARADGRHRDGARPVRLDDEAARLRGAARDVASGPVHAPAHESHSRGACLPPRASRDREGEDLRLRLRPVREPSHRGRSGRPAARLGAGGQTSAPPFSGFRRRSPRPCRPPFPATGRKRCCGSASIRRRPSCSPAATRAAWRTSPGSRRRRECDSKRKTGSRVSSSKRNRTVACGCGTRYRRATRRLPMQSATDRIQKTVLLRAPLERVWRAISDPGEFGTWFGVAFAGPFVAGARVTGRIVPTKVDAEIAKAQEPYAGAKFECSIDRVAPMRLFSFRWNPYGVEQGVDYSEEPTTLVTFALEESPGGTKLTITETGFDQIPLERRAKAFSANAEGWAMQAKLIEKYLEAAS